MGVTHSSIESKPGLPGFQQFLATFVRPVYQWLRRVLAGMKTESPSLLRIYPIVGKSCTAKC